MTAPAATRRERAAGHGQVTMPESDDAPNHATGRGVLEQATDNTDFRADGLADQAVEFIAGEAAARAYIAALTDGRAEPGTLAALLCVLRDEALHGFCRVLTRALLRG